MYRRVACIFLASIASLVLVPTAAPAYHGYDQPIRLHSGTASGPFWVAYKVKTNGAGIATHFRADNLAMPNQVGAMIYKGNKLYFGITGSYFAGHNGAFVDVNAVPDQPVHFERSEPTPEYPWTIMAMNMNGYGTQKPYVGELTFVWWIAGGNTGVQYSIEAEAGVELTGGRLCPPEATSCTYGTGWESGTKAFVYTSTDFTGAVNAKAGVGFAAARAHVAVSRSVTIGETFLGSFMAFGTHADQLKAERPGGVTQDCSPFACNFVNLDQYRAGPGKYTFSATGVGGGPGLTYFGDFIVGGIDMHVPA